MSRVSRFKICCYELGDGLLSSGEQILISAALRAEAERLRSLSIQIDFGQPRPTAVDRASGDPTYRPLCSRSESSEANKKHE
jgi:hypothetical protein